MNRQSILHGMVNPLTVGTRRQARLVGHQGHFDTLQKSRKYRLDTKGPDAGRQRKVQGR